MPKRLTGGWMIGGCVLGCALSFAGCSRSLHTTTTVATLLDTSAPVPRSGSAPEVEPPTDSAALPPTDGVTEQPAAAPPDTLPAERPGLRDQAGASVEPPLPLMSRQPTTEVDPAVTPETPERIEDSIMVAEVAPGPDLPTPDARLERRLSELRDIFFAFDSWGITEESKQTLSGNADWLREHPVPVAIEGHCDERGTQAYNLVLGEKRARAIKSYLINLGIEASQLSVVSYGKERPFCAGHDEPCYQQNRRGHLTLSRSERPSP